MTDNLKGTNFQIELRLNQYTYAKKNTFKESVEKLKERYMISNQIQNYIYRNKFILLQ